MPEVYCRRVMSACVKAADPSTDPSVLMKLVRAYPEDLESPWVRTDFYKALLSNPSLPVEGLEYISDLNTHPSLWTMIVNHPNMTVELFESFIIDEEEEINESDAEFLELLAGHEFASEKLIVFALRNSTMAGALKLGADPRLSTETITQLLEGAEHPMVAVGLTANPNVSGELLDVLIDRVSWLYRFMAVTNPNLTAEQAELLKKDHYEWVSTWANLRLNENLRNPGMPTEWYLATMGLDLSVFQKSPDGVMKSWDSLVNHLRNNVVQKWCAENL